MTAEQTILSKLPSPRYLGQVIAVEGSVSTKLVQAEWDRAWSDSEGCAVPLANAKLVWRYVKTFKVEDLL